MTLYEINEQIKAIMDAMNVEMDENGEFDYSYIDQLNELNQARDQKLEAIGCYIKNLDAEAKAIKAEEDALKERRERLEAKAERLEEYVKNDILSHGETKKEFTRVAFSFRTSTQVSITNADAIPKEYKEERVEWVPVKKDIKTALQLGKDVPGAELVTNQNLQIK